MLYTGEKPVDPLIVNVWPLASGGHSSYSVYEDSGVAEQYQKGVCTNLPVQASHTGGTLKVEIGPVQGSFPGMMRRRGYELRLPADWPPASVTVNGIAMQKAAKKLTGWHYDGNTLTTYIPVSNRNVASKVTIEVRRATGMTARRNELDGFPGQMTRLREVYQAMRETLPASDSTDPLILAYETGDRIGDRPETAVTEIANFHEAIAKAQASVREKNATFDEHAKAAIKREDPRRFDPNAPSIAELMKRRNASMSRATKLMEDTGKQSQKD
jgi:hypothetical protein